MLPLKEKMTMTTLKVVLGTVTNDIRHILSVLKYLLL